MATFWKRTPQTVRPRLSYKTSVLFCLLVFAFTAIVVYWRGHDAWLASGSRRTYTATAYLVPQAGLPSRVEPLTNQSNCDSRIPICQTGDTPEQALEALESSADRHVRDCRAEWKSRVEGRAMKARQVAEDARKACAEATSQRNAFSRQTDEAARTATLRSAVKPPAAPTPTMTDNPRWFDLQEQFSSLQRRYDELLVDRTPLHPAAQEVAARMASLKEQMASVSQRIPAGRETMSQANTSDAAEPPAAANRSSADGPVDVQNADAIVPPDKKKWSELVAAVERTRQACSEAEMAEKLALQARQAVPSFALEAAHVVEGPAQAGSGWRRLLATTLATSLMMALGFGSFTAGAGIEPPVTNVAELEGDLGLTVLGTVRAANASTNSAAKTRRRSRLRSVLIALGLTLMCVCPVIAIWGMVGM